MKQIVSVWMAAAKHLWWKLLLVLSAMTAAEVFLYRRAVDNLLSMYEGAVLVSFHGIIAGGKLQLVFFAALAAVIAVCCLQGCRFSGKNLYMLQRLPLAEWQITVLWAMVHLGCLLILWAAQLLVVFILWKLYALEFSPASPGIALLVSLYSNGFLHTLLPLADIPRWIFLLVYWLSVAWLTACFGFHQRRGRFKIGLLVMIGVYFPLILEMGNGTSNILFALLCLAMAAGNIYGMWGACHEPKTN